MGFKTKSYRLLHPKPLDPKPLKPLNPFRIAGNRGFRTRARRPTGQHASLCLRSHVSYSSGPISVPAKGYTGFYKRRIYRVYGLESCIHIRFKPQNPDMLLRVCWDVGDLLLRQKSYMLKPQNDPKLQILNPPCVLGNPKLQTPKPRSPRCSYKSPNSIFRPRPKPNTLNPIDPNP